MPDEATTTTAESIAAAVAKVLGRRAIPDDDDWEEPRRGGGRAEERIRTLRLENKRLEEELTALTGKVGELSTAYEARLGTIQEQAAEELKRIRSGTQQDFALHEAGLTDSLGRSTLRQAWESLPKESRGKDPVDYWQATLAAREAHLADPEKVEAPTIPRPLTPYLPAVEEQQEQQRQTIARVGVHANTRERPKVAGADDIKAETPEDFIRQLAQMERAG